MSEFNTQTGQRPPTAINPEAIPRTGYDLGPTETIELAVYASEVRPNGYLIGHGETEQVPYTSIGTLRIGGAETFEDLDIAVMKSPKGGEFVGLLRTGKDGYKTWIAASGPDGLEVGRSSSAAGLEHLPDTVSATHVRLSHDKETNTLQVMNLNPTNRTTILSSNKPAEVAFVPTSPRRPDKPTLEAMMAIDPTTGKPVYAGSQTAEQTVFQLFEQAAKQAELERVLGKSFGNADALKAAAEAAKRRLSERRERSKPLPR
jgi:hypothetical protein